MNAIRLFVLLGSLLALIACERGELQQSSDRNPITGSFAMVSVRLIDQKGELTPPVEVPKLELSDAQWRQRLTLEQFRILRSSGTERPFCSGFLSNKEPGVYVCVGCNLPLFETQTKFESGTGWPSFFQPIARENVVELPDHSHGMTRIEVNCARCGGHLGHVFEDGPRPTGLRFCINGEVLRFVPMDQLATLAELVPDATTSGDKPSPQTLAAPEQRAELVLAGGCFWCVEAVFEEIDGVYEVVSGYSGGEASTANYDAVCTGKTGHAEAVRIIYDPARVSVEQLLRIHFATHDPTTLNRQGNDVGPQYRSTIFYANDEQKQIAQAFIDDLNDAKVFNRPIVTTLEPLKAFYPAEAYHQDYVACNPGQAYVRAIALPKVDKVRKQFKDMLKPAGSR